MFSALVPVGDHGQGRESQENEAVQGAACLYLHMCMDLSVCGCVGLCALHVVTFGVYSP